MVPAIDVYAIPESLTFHEAAGLAFDYLTAYVTLFRHASLQKGQKVLIHRASEGIVSHVQYGNSPDLHRVCVRGSLLLS